jgi:hypothetical protein
MARAGTDPVTDVIIFFVKLSLALSAITQLYNKLGIMNPRSHVS